MDDLRAAHGWLLRVSDLDGALRLPAALGEYAFFRLRDEITTWARRAAALPGAEVSLDVDPAGATAAFERAVALAREVENALIEGVSLVSLASLLGRRGDTENAALLFREVVTH